MKKTTLKTTLNNDDAGDSSNLSDEFYTGCINPFLEMPYITSWPLMGKIINGTCKPVVDIPQIEPPQ